MAAERERTFQALNKKIDRRISAFQTQNGVGTGELQFTDLLEEGDKSEFEELVRSHPDIQALRPEEKSAYYACAVAFLSQEELKQLLEEKIVKPMVREERAEDELLHPLLLRMVDMRKQQELKFFLEICPKKYLDPQLISEIMGHAIEVEESLEMPRLLMPYMDLHNSTVRQFVFLRAIHEHSQNRDPNAGARKVAWLAAQGVKISHEELGDIYMPSREGETAYIRALTMLIVCFPELSEAPSLPRDRQWLAIDGELLRLPRPTEAQDLRQPFWDVARRDAKEMRDRGEAKAFSMGTNEKAGKNSAMQRSFARDVLFEKHLVTMISEYVEPSHLQELRTIKKEMDREGAKSRCWGPNMAQLQALREEGKLQRARGPNESWMAKVSAGEAFQLE